MSAAAETPGFETLALERVDNHVTMVRLNRPDASNALNTQMGRDLVAVSKISRSTRPICVAWC